MSTNSSSPEQMPGSSRGSFRQFFLGVGAALLGLVAYFYWREPRLPPVIPVVVGGIGLLLLLMGVLWPAPKPLTAVERQNRVVQEGEEVLRTGPANHLRGWENRGGTLNLTSQRLTFFSHGLNWKNADVVISLADVVGVERARTLWIIPNAFRVITADGTRHQFTVFSPKKWMEAIRAACPSSKG
jgi:hypothetical protein